MLRLCKGCDNELSETDVACERCGLLADDDSGEAVVSAAVVLDTEETSKYIEPIVGLHDHPVAKVSLLLAICNLLVGPVAAFISLFCPLIPYTVFAVIPLAAFFVVAIISPLVALLCLLLDRVVRRTYAPEKHTTRSLKWLKNSYILSTFTTFIWLILVVASIALTFM